VPIILIVLIISYRYIKQRNFELQEAEEKLRFAEVEKQRRAIYHKMFESHRQKEAEIEKLLNEMEEPQAAVPVIEAKSIKTDALGLEMQGESTDDEFFEEPIARSSKSPLYEKIKISPKLEHFDASPPPRPPVNIRAPPLQSDF
jgi:hypothetical protein